MDKTQIRLILIGYALQAKEDHLNTSNQQYTLQRIKQYIYIYILICKLTVDK